MKILTDVRIDDVLSSSLYFLNENCLNQINNLSKEKKNSWVELGNMVNRVNNFFKEVTINPSISYQDFRNDMWSILDSLHNANKNLDKSALRRRQSFFRGSLFSFLSRSLVLNRALTKPYGYPGDFFMLQTLYNKKPISQDRLGCYLDQFFIEDDLAQAVIDRVEVMGDRVVDFIQSSNKDELNILNIASGSGFELNKVISQNYKKKINYHCFDQEAASLAYIASNFHNKNPNVEIILYKEDIRRFFRSWKSKNKFDFVYNIGLADYLPDLVLSSLVKESLDHLATSGVFVLAHKDYNLFPYHHPSWLYDWNFIHRSLEDYKELLLKTTNQQFKIWFESSKKIIYFSEFVKAAI